MQNTDRYVVLGDLSFLSNVIYVIAILISIFANQVYIFPIFAALSVIGIIFVWIRPDKDVGARIISTFSLVCFGILPNIIPYKATLMLYAVLAVLLFVLCFVYRKFLAEEAFINTLIWIMLTVNLFVFLFSDFMNYSFVTDTPRFMLGALIAGAVFALILTLLFSIKKKKASAVIGWFFMYTLLAFIFFWTVTGHVNFVLDDSEPLIYEHVIVDKRISRSRKGPDSYYVYFEDDGERVSFDIGSAAYKRCQIGDKIILCRMEGGLGEPYYVSVSFLEKTKKPLLSSAPNLT